MTLIKVLEIKKLVFVFIIAYNYMTLLCFILKNVRNCSESMAKANCEHYCPPTLQCPTRRSRIGVRANRI